MIKNEIDRGPVLQSQLFLQQIGIAHFCTMRDCKEPGKDVWMPRQVHGTNVVIVNGNTAFDKSLELQPIEADAVITRQKGLWIGVRTADCVPVLIYDPIRSVVAAVHAGWRGTVNHIVSVAIGKMEQEMGCEAKNLLAMIGPSISPEAFEVGEEVAQAFIQAGRAECVLREMRGSRSVQRLAKPHVDLWQSNVMDLLEAGVQLENIDCTPICTFENWNEIYSARREGIGTGRIVSAIQISR